MAGSAWKFKEEIDGPRGDSQRGYRSARIPGGRYDYRKGSRDWKIWKYHFRPMVCEWMTARGRWERKHLRSRDIAGSPGQIIMAGKIQAAPDHASRVLKSPMRGQESHKLASVDGTLRNINVGSAEEEGENILNVRKGNQQFLHESLHLRPKGLYLIREFSSGGRDF